MYRYISRLLLVSASTWIVVTTETNGTVDGLQQVKPSAATTIYVCRNKACCQRWKLKTTLPDVLHDILTSNEMYNSSKRISIEKSSCLGQCDKGPNLRISSGTAEDVYANGINDVVGLIAELDETLSISVPSKLIAAVTIFDKAQTGTFP
jgi:NADH:ubiquinone oxidoreductase subunit E